LCSTSLDDFETSVFQQVGGFKPSPSEVQVSHQFDTLNRRIDAEYKTDVFRVKGHVRLERDEEGPYTRIFEPIGDWVPNLLVGDVEGVNLFVRATFKAVRKDGDNFYISPRESRTPVGYERYLTFNGKTIFVRRSSDAMPTFLNFRGCDEYENADLRSVRVNATTEEILKDSVSCERPLTVQELFADAVKRGAKQKRSPTKLQLFPYFRPTIDQLGNTDAAREFISSSWSDVAQIHPLTDKGYKEILLDLISEFKANLPRAQKDEQEDLSLLWDAMTKNIRDDITEDEAKKVYLTLIDSLTEGKYDSDASLIPTGTYLEPVEMENGDVRTLALEVHIDGKPYYVHSRCFGYYPVLMPYSIVPDNCDVTLTTLLSLLPNLRKKGLEILHGSYLVSVEVLARSSTPRSKEGSAKNTQWQWFEPMAATVLFNGPIFTAGSDETGELNAWVVALNSAFLEGVVRRNMKTDHLQVMRPLHPKNLPDGKPSPNFMGVGLRSGQVVDCDLRNKRVKWDTHFCTDLRLRLPLPLISALLLSPNSLLLCDVESYFDGTKPLVIRARSEDGNWKEHLYQTSLIFQHGGKGEKSYTEVLGLGPERTQHTRIDDEDDEVLFDPKPKRRTQKEKARQTTPSVVESEVPSQREDVAYRASGRDFKDVKYFSHQSLGYQAGDWDGVFKYFESKGQKIDILKEMYTIHWQTANGGFTHPITAKHHPAWTSSLKMKALLDERSARVSGKTLHANPNLQVDDNGCQAIAEKNEADFIKADKKKKAAGALTSFGGPSTFDFKQGSLWSDAPYSPGAPYYGWPRGGGGRGRGNRGRGRGFDFLAAPHVSTEQSGTSNLGFNFGQ
jgi:hypothetical protein